jgi:hypothetical protein
MVHAITSSMRASSIRGEARPSGLSDRIGASR